MDKLTKKLLRIANEKADPRSCLHHFAICENCGSRINILKLAEIINTKKSSKPSLNSNLIQDFEDILENYRGDYFKVNINKFNQLKEKWSSNIGVEIVES